MITLLGSIGLPQYRMKGYKCYLSSSTGYLSTKSYDIPDLSPGQGVTIMADDLYKGKGIVTIVRPTGYIVTQKSFY